MQHVERGQDADASRCSKKTATRHRVGGKSITDTVGAVKRSRNLFIGRSHER